MDDKQQRITHHFQSKANGGPVPRSDTRPPPSRRSTRLSPLKVEEATAAADSVDDDIGADASSAAMKDEDDEAELQSSRKPPPAAKAQKRQSGRKRGRLTVKEEEEEVGEEENVKQGKAKGEERVKDEEEEEEAADEMSADALPKAENGTANTEDAGEGEGDGDDAGEWDAATSSIQTQLTYEQQRQANIRRNAEQMRLLQIPTLLPTLPPTQHRKKQPAQRGTKRMAIPQRRSLRNQGLDPEGNLADIKEGEGRYVPDVSSWQMPSRKEGPLDMADVLVQVRGSYDSKEEKEAEEEEEEEGEDGALVIDGDEEKGEAKVKAVDPVVDSVCRAFAELTTQPRGAKQAPLPPPLTSARIAALRHIGMTNKLTKKRCTTMAFHPSSSLTRSILVSGDKAGQMGVMVYSDHTQLHADSVQQCAFEPHAGGINSFAFHSRTQSLYSASNDGCIRHFAFEQQRFTEAFVNDGEDGLYTITSSPHHPSSLFTCDRKGDLLILDASSPSSLTLSSRTSLSHLKVNCVDVHPGGHLLASCGNDRTVRLWDLRRLKPDTPLHSFEHGYSVNSVFFSPSGGLLLSTCIDNFVRVWGVQGDDVGGWPPCTRIAHNNTTGRWVTLFRARWTRTDDAFLIGNMRRQVDVYGWDGGAWTADKAALKEPNEYAMTSADLTAIPSVVVVHPSNTYFLAATASAYAYVWSL